MKDLLKRRIEEAIKEKVLSQLKEEKKRTVAAIFGEPIFEGVEDALELVKDFHGSESSMKPHEIAQSFGYKYKTAQSQQGNQGKFDRTTTVTYKHPKTRATLTVSHRSRPNTSTPNLHGPVHHSFSVRHDQLPNGGYDGPNDMEKLSRHLTGLHASDKK